MGGLEILVLLINLTARAIWLAIVGTCWAISATWKALVTNPGQRKHAERRAAEAEAHRRAAWDHFYAWQAEQQRQQAAAQWWALNGPGWQPDQYLAAAPPAQPLATDWSAEPLANDDGDGPCIFCDHKKEHHADDFYCQMPGCNCEAEVYPPARWQAGAPMQFRDQVIDLETGTVRYEKVMA